MESRKKAYVTFIALIALVTMLYFFSDWFSKTTGFSIGEDPDNYLAKCLSQTGSLLYTTDSCPECKKQEQLFGTSAYRFLNYVDCSVDRNSCSDLKLLPAWNINGTLHYGVKSTGELRFLSGCN